MLNSRRSQWKAGLARLAVAVALLIVFIPAVVIAQTNPIPFVNNPLVPTSVAPGGSQFTLTVNGTGFVSGATVNWNGVALATTFVSGSRLTATVPAAKIATAGTASITVTNPAPGGGESDVLYFPITKPRASVSFVQSSTASGLDYPLDLTTGDFNGDGKVDLATVGATYLSNLFVSIRLGNGDGTFGQTLLADVSDWDSADLIYRGDFNGDGKPDLVGSGDCHAPSFGGGCWLFSLSGNGDGTFASHSASFQALHSMDGDVFSLLPADFNRDGKLDLLFVGRDVETRLGNGDGTFQAPFSSGVAPGEAAVGDFNRDGKLDLAVSANNLITIYNGVGDGTFQAGNSYSSIPSGPVTAADLNGDGKLDLVLFNGTIMLGNGDGTFQTAVPYASPALSGRATVVDLNGDGKVDLAINSTTAIEILLGNGDGTFQTPITIATHTYPLLFGTGPVGHLLAADFDGDGRLDLAAVGADAYPILLFIQPQPVMLQPSKLDFGGEPVGTTSASQPVTLTNYQTAALTVSSIDITGTNPGDFAQTNDCPSSLAAGADCTINVTFTPTVGGSRTATLTVSDDGPGSPHTATLTGTGTAPVVTFSSGTLTFSTQPVGTTSAAQPVILTNTGGAPLTVASIAVTGTNAGDFAQTNNCGSSLAVGHSCTLSVTFTPLAGAARGASLTVTDNASGSPHSVVLNGTGAAVPELTIAMAHSGDFTQCQTEAPYTVSVSNLGTLASSGTVSVVDTLPTGLSATALSGAGWTCTLATLTCTRSDVLAGASSYPPITLAVNVAAEAPASVTNTATLSGGGDITSANNTAADLTTILQPPTADAVTPTPASGANRTFSLAYSVHNGKGYADLQYVMVLINPRMTGAQGCYVRYNQTANKLYLQNDAGTGTLGPLTPGSAGTLANSQCTLNGAGTTVSGAGATLTLNLSVSATSNFLGTRNIYMLAQDCRGVSSDWQNRGTWTPMGADIAPTADSVTPTPASGANQTFSLSYTVQNGKGFTDLTYAMLLINPKVIGAQGCYVRYYQPANQMYLENDAGTGALGPLTPGSAGTLANSQCTLNGTGTTASGSGATLTLSLSLSAASSFLGSKNIYMLAQDSEGSSSDWQNRGTWTPMGANTPPTADAATPTPASGASQTFSVAYSTHNGKGYTDLTWVRALFNSRLTGPLGCYVLYYQPWNQLYLENDAATGMLGPLTPGTVGTLANSQCMLNGTGTTVLGSGATLTLNLSVSAAPSFLGTKNIYLLAQDSEGTSSVWQNRGAWTP